MPARQSLWRGKEERKGKMIIIRKLSPKETKEKRKIMKCGHQFIDADNEGFYGQETCIFCGYTQHK